MPADWVLRLKSAYGWATDKNKYRAVSELAREKYLQHYREIHVLPV